jgi:hypothetical protein
LVPVNALAPRGSGVLADCGFNGGLPIQIWKKNPLGASYFAVKKREHVTPPWRSRRKKFT